MDNKILYQVNNSHVLHTASIQVSLLYNAETHQKWNICDAKMPASPPCKYRNIIITVPLNMSTDPSEALVTEVFTNTSITHYPGFSPSSLVMNIVTSPVWQVPSRYTHDVHIIGSQAGVEVIHNLYIILTVGGLTFSPDQMIVVSLFLWQNMVC